jgi:ABC-type multidrug transport system fused ATPase/permease subunit
MRSPFIVIGATIMAFTVDAKASMVFLITLPVLIIIVFGIMFVSIPLYKKVQGKLDTVTLKSRENLSGARVIKAFNQEKREIEEFSNATNELTKEQLFVGRISSFLNSLTYAVVNLSIAALIWKGAGRVELGILKQGQVYALVNYMSQILIELVKLANLIIIETKAVACANRLESVLKQESSIVYADNANDSKAVNASSGNKVEFKNVGLTYKGAKASSIEGVNLSVGTGETVGIIGGTGSGKSTLVNLIPRFYDCTEGEILIDGVDIKSYSKETLNEKIGVVPQRAVLFTGSIADNLKWGKADATDAEMDEALDIAQAKDFVEEKEGGKAFLLNRGAKNLSGGQKQRLTIARALIKKPEILILDDSSSALDYATDAALRKAIKEKTDNTTVFMVSQRASSIMYADKIVVLDDGQVVGLGTHDELLKNCEVYQEIYNSQNKTEDDHKIQRSMGSGVMA